MQFSHASLLAAALLPLLATATPVAAPQPDPVAGNPMLASVIPTYIPNNGPGTANGGADRNQPGIVVSVNAASDYNVKLTCGDKGKTTKNMMAPLAKEIDRIPTSGTKTTACHVISCAGYLCAYPTVDGYDWPSVKGANAAINQLGVSGYDGCAAGALDGKSISKGALVFGYISTPNNQPGKYIKDCGNIK